MPIMLGAYQVRAPVPFQVLAGVSGVPVMPSHLCAPFVVPHGIQFVFNVLKYRVRENLDLRM